jgi:uncharacterized RDD family membrane protein YckC
MLCVMNAIAQASASPARGPKLDNRRVAAGLVDLAIVALGAVVILYAGDALSGDRSEVRGALGAVIVGWALYYFFALESGDGQTVGKKVLKLRVVRADGGEAGMREIAVRTVLRVVDNYLVGLIVMLATGDRRQRIGDLAAGTIIVDASAPAAPVAAPPAEAVEEVEEDEVEEPEEDEADEAAPAAGKTITLPARPAPPATLADITAPAAPAPTDDEAAVAAEPVAEVEPVAVEEPVVQIEPVVVEEPVAEVEPVVVEEPVVEVEPVVERMPVEPDRVVEDEPVVEVREELAPVSSPAIEGLAHDVAAARSSHEPVMEPDRVDDVPVDDGPVTVRSVETVSAIDLVMGGASEDDSPEDTSESAPDAGDSASR